MPTIIPKTIPTYYCFNQGNPDKKFSGDYAYAENITINNKPFVILLQADGVSSAQKDYEASERSINQIIKYFKENSRREDVSNILYESIYHAHEQLLMGKDTKGMLTTITAMVIDEINNQVWYTHAGDSRIYAFSGKEWVQLTEDHSTTTIYKENGKPVLQNGKPVFRSMLTQCIGTLLKLEIKITSSSNSGYYGFCLVSDGFYELENSPELMSQFFHAIDHHIFIDKVSPRIREAQKDDASIALWRKPISGLTISNLNFDKYKGYSKASLYPIIRNIYEISVEQANYQMLSELVDTMINMSIYKDKDELISILDHLYSIHSHIDSKIIHNLKSKISKI